MSDGIVRKNKLGGNQDQKPTQEDKVVLPTPFYVPPRQQPEPAFYQQEEGMYDGLPSMREQPTFADVPSFPQVEVAKKHPFAGSTLILRQKWQMSQEQSETTDYIVEFTPAGTSAIIRRNISSFSPLNVTVEVYEGKIHLNWIPTKTHKFICVIPTSPLSSFPVEATEIWAPLGAKTWSEWNHSTTRTYTLLNTYWSGEM